MSWQPCVRAGARALSRKPLSRIADPLRRLLFGHEISAQHYSHADISPYFWVNGRTPKEENYLAMAGDQFANYSLWLANCYFAHNSLRFSALLSFFNASSGRAHHPLNRHPGPVARTRRRPFPRCGVPSAQAPTPDRESHRHRQALCPPRLKLGSQITLITEKYARIRRQTTTWLAMKKGSSL